MPKSLNQAARLQRAVTILTNIQNTPTIAGELQHYGYSEERLKTATSLIDEVTILNNRQQAEYAGQYQASENFEKAFVAANKSYIRSLKIARIAFGDNTGARVSLLLDGSRQKVYSGWAKQAESFYSNLLADKNYMQAVAVFNLQPEILSAEYKAVKELAALSSFHQKEKGEAIAATQSRDDKFMELDKFISELSRICKIAFAESPEHLKMIGIIQ